MAVPAGMALSLTFTVKRIGAVVEFADVGVPLISPVAEFNAKPWGRALGGGGRISDHVYGFVPPVAASVAEYRAPTLALGREVVVITSGAGAGEACTVSVVLPVITVPDNDNVANMVGLPADTPVATLPLIVATVVLDDAQVTWVVIFCVLRSE